MIRELEPKFREEGDQRFGRAGERRQMTGAQSRNLAVMVGGDFRAVFERVKPLLDAFGDKVFYAG